MPHDVVPALNGLLVVDKPVGWTSHDVVGRVRRLVGMKRVGHGGTLDPFATGVLVVAVGPATRVLQYVQDGDKRYQASIVLGVETDSSDVDGTVQRRMVPDEWPSEDAVRGAVATFRGVLQQVPPAHSAIRIGGRRLYERARAGEHIDVPTREVTIYSIEVCAYQPPTLDIAVHCGKGTYIRALARDIGAALGVGAYCHALQRTQNGPFCLGDAWTIEDLEQRDLRAEWPAVAKAPDLALSSLSAAIIGEDETRAWYHGRPVATRLEFGPAPPGGVRVYDAGGAFLGIGRQDAQAISPAVVLPYTGEEASS
jgi:tRNA pseudouridine55 synthase